MTRPELVLFDLDGTLLDDGGLPAAMRATCTVVAAGLPGVEPDALVAANRAAWALLWPEAEDRYMLEDDGQAVLLEAWRETLSTFGVDDPSAAAGAEAEWERQEAAALRLFPDVRAALRDLEDAGIRAGMVTNGAGAVQRRKLRAVGLEGRFVPMIVSSDVGAKKPDPVIFEAALQAADLDGSSVRFVGDHLWHDIEGAAAAGIGAVWLDRAHAGREPSWPRPAAVLHSLDELVPTLLAG